jgi:hypothetical protein
VIDPVGAFPKIVIKNKLYYVPYPAQLSISYVVDPARRRHGYGTSVIAALVTCPQLAHVSLFVADRCSPSRAHPTQAGTQPASGSSRPTSRDWPPAPLAAVRESNKPSQTRKPVISNGPCPPRPRSAASPPGAALSEDSARAAAAMSGGPPGLGPVPDASAGRPQSPAYRPWRTPGTAP